MQHKHKEDDKKKSDDHKKSKDKGSKKEEALGCPKTVPNDFTGFDPLDPLDILNFRQRNELRSMQPDEGNKINDKGAKKGETTTARPNPVQLAPTTQSNPYVRLAPVDPLVVPEFREPKVPPRRRSEDRNKNDTKSDKKKEAANRGAPVKPVSTLQSRLSMQSARSAQLNAFLQTRQMKPLPSMPNTSAQAGDLHRQVPANAIKKQKVSN